MFITAKNALWGYYVVLVLLLICFKKGARSAMEAIYEVQMF